MAGEDEKREDQEIEELVNVTGLPADVIKFILARRGLTARQILDDRRLINILMRDARGGSTEREFLDDLRTLGEIEGVTITVDSSPFHEVEVRAALFDSVKNFVREEVRIEFAKLQESTKSLKERMEVLDKLMLDVSEEEAESIVANLGAPTVTRAGGVRISRIPKDKVVFIHVPYIFFTDKGEQWDFVRWADGPSKNLRTVVASNFLPRLVAVYARREKAEYVHTRRPTAFSPYQRGVSSVIKGGPAGPVRGRVRAVSENATASLQLPFLRGRFGRDVTPRQPRTDPYLLASVNKGKRILNKYAVVEYKRLFVPFKKNWENRRKKLIEKKKQAARARREWIAIATYKGGWKRFRPIFSKKEQAKQDAQMHRESVANARKQYEDALNDYKKEYEDFYNDFREDIEKTSLAMRQSLEKKANVIALELARRYRAPFGRAEISGVELIERQIQEELKIYAQQIAERFATRGNTLLFKLQRGVENVGRGTETFGAAGMNVLQNTWDFIFGPWTWTSILVIFQFFFVLTYVGYNIYYLWIFPIIGALFTFLMNFTDSFRPLDWWTHLMSGANIGYSALLLLIALDALDWTGSTVWFWIVWAVLGFIGVMQFYQIGGWRVILQGAIIVLFFAWLALGPYSAYYQQALDQVKKPVEIVYNGVKDAFTNIWLLATNPTEFYARQQVINIRPERPVDLEKGVEVTLLEALPQSVPADQEFGLTAVLSNEGVINESAKDIKLTFSCNQWCDSRGAAPVQDDVFLARNQVSGQTRIFYLEDKMDRGDAVSLNVRGFKALGDSVRVGETRIAKVKFNLSYNYSSSSSLLTEVMGQDEVNRRLQNNEDLFRNVLAVAKLSPAQLSLNVGPQPLISSTKTVLLLVSVFSMRDDGTVKLPAGSRIIVTLPKTIGENLVCNNYRPTALYNDKEVVEYIVPSDVEILARKFNSIFSFICEFTPRPVSNVKSDLITAELPSYIFVLQREKDVPVTPPVGIIFDPFEKNCNARGGSDCLGKNNPSQGYTCWYQQYGLASEAVIDTFSNVCHSCGLVKSCSYFRTLSDCNVTNFPNSGASVCGKQCEWIFDAQAPGMIDTGTGFGPDIQGSGLDPNRGYCIEKTEFAVTGSCSLTDTSSIAKETIVGYIENNAPSGSILKGKGAELYDAAVRNNVNPAFMLALAIHEGGWGTSRVAQCKLNTFGWGAQNSCTDQCSDAPNCAKRFSSVGEGISAVAKGVYDGWLSPAPTKPPQRTTLDQMSGATPTSNGWLVYATDNNWPSAMATWMSKITGKVCSPTVADGVIVGSPNFCSQALIQSQTGCGFGFGGCQSSNECNALPKEVGASGKSYSLECRDPGAGAKLCCYQQKTDDGETLEQSNLRCIEKYNEIK